jgi:hypothetical protein
MSYDREEETGTFQCFNCRGNKVQTLMWVDLNTNEIKGEGLGETQDNYCEDCQQNVDIITI